jgi:hypothetical protein
MHGHANSFEVFTAIATKGEGAPKNLCKFPGMTPIEGFGFQFPSTSDFSSRHKRLFITPLTSPVASPFHSDSGCNTNTNQNDRKDRFVRSPGGDARRRERKISEFLQEMTAW